MRRRELLAGLAATAMSPLAGCGAGGREAALSTRSAVFIPGYFAGQATLVNPPTDSRRRQHERGPKTLLTRIDSAGAVRQAVFPVIGHDVAISPDGRVGFLGRMNAGGGAGAAHHVAFDPDTLEMIAVGRPPGEGWRGGGHGLFLPDGKRLLCSERVPMGPYSGRPDRHYGRISIRDPETLKLLDSFDCHGIDPHELRLSADGRHVAIANYGSVAARGADAKSAPRRVVEPSVSVVALDSGALVARYLAPDPETELRHLSLGRDGQVFGIRCRLGAEGADAPWQRRIGATEADRTADPGASYLAAAPVMATPGRTRAATLAPDEDPAHLRHGLSVEYEPEHDEFIASFPSSHRLIVFSGRDGRVRRSIDTRALGLDYPCGVTLLPGRDHYAVAGYWQGLHLFERGSHRHDRRLGHGAMFYGHSHMTAV